MPAPATRWSTDRHPSRSSHDPTHVKFDKSESRQASAARRDQLSAAGALGVHDDAVWRFSLNAQTRAQGTPPTWAPADFLALAAHRPMPSRVTLRACSPWTTSALEVSDLVRWGRRSCQRTLGHHCQFAAIPAFQQSGRLLVLRSYGGAVFSVIRSSRNTGITLGRTLLRLKTLLEGWLRSSRFCTSATPSMRTGYAVMLVNKTGYGASTVTLAAPLAPGFIIDGRGDRGLAAGSCSLRCAVPAV